MCEPTTIMLVASAVISGATAYSASQTRKDQADYQSKVAANNAKVAEWQAADAKERGDQAAAATRRRAAALQGSQAASLAARGLDISSGSANAILTDTDFFGEYDQNIVRANAARESYGYQVRAGNFRGDAAAARAMSDAENPLLSGVLAAGQSFLGSGEGRTVAGKWFGSGG